MEISAPASAPPAPAAAPSPVNSWWLVGGLFALGAFVTGVFTTLVPWWSVSSKATGFALYLTGSIQIIEVASSVLNVSIPYVSVEMLPIEVLYTAILALVIGSLALSLVAGVLAIGAAVGRVRQPYWGRALRTFVVVALVLALAATVAGPAAQPTALSREKGSFFDFCDLNPGGATPCSKFWSSEDSTGTPVYWGPSLGWFLALTSSVLLLVALFAWFQGRPRVAAPAVTVPPPALSVPPPVPPPA